MGHLGSLITLGVGVAAGVASSYWYINRVEPIAMPCRCRNRPLQPRRPSRGYCTTAIPWACPTPRRCRRRTPWAWTTSRSMARNRLTTAPWLPRRRCKSWAYARRGSTRQLVAQHSCQCHGPGRRNPPVRNRAEVRGLGRAPLRRPDRHQVAAVSPAVGLQPPDCWRHRMNLASPTTPHGNSRPTIPKAPPCATARCLAGATAQRSNYAAGASRSRQRRLGLRRRTRWWSTSRSCRARVSPPATPSCAWPTCRRSGWSPTCRGRCRPVALGQRASFRHLTLPGRTFEGRVSSCSRSGPGDAHAGSTDRIAQSRWPAAPGLFGDVVLTRDASADVLTVPRSRVHRQRHAAGRAGARAKGASSPGR